MLTFSASRRDRPPATWGSGVRLRPRPPDLDGDDLDLDQDQDLDQDSRGGGMVEGGRTKIPSGVFVHLWVVQNNQRWSFLSF